MRYNPIADRVAPLNGLPEKKKVEFEHRYPCGRQLSLLPAGRLLRSALSQLYFILQSLAVMKNLVIPQPLLELGVII